MQTTCPALVDLYEKHLQAIPHPEAGLLKLVQFSHDSPGLRKLRRYIAEGFVLLAESNGFLLSNGLSESVSHLESAGYTVTPPKAKTAPRKRAAAKKALPKSSGVSAYAGNEL